MSVNEVIAQLSAFIAQLFKLIAQVFQSIVKFSTFIVTGAELIARNADGFAVRRGQIVSVLRSIAEMSECIALDSNKATEWSQQHWDPFHIHISCSSDPIRFPFFGFPIGAPLFESRQAESKRRDIRDYRRIFKLASKTYLQTLGGFAALRLCESPFLLLLRRLK